MISELLALVAVQEREKQEAAGAYRSMIWLPVFLVLAIAFSAVIA